MKGFLSFITFSLLFTCGTLVSSAQNYKIKQTISMNGQTMSSTTFVKGSRKRTETSGMMGMGGDVANIEQCDLKRNVKVSDTKRMYFVEPFATDADIPVGPATAIFITRENREVALSPSPRRREAREYRRRCDTSPCRRR